MNNGPLGHWTGGQIGKVDSQIREQLENCFRDRSPQWLLPATPLYTLRYESSLKTVFEIRVLNDFCPLYTLCQIRQDKVASNCYKIFCLLCQLSSKCYKAKHAEIKTFTLVCHTLCHPPVQGSVNVGKCMSGVMHIISTSWFLLNYLLHYMCAHIL